MAPTRDKSLSGPVIDTGTGSPATPRPDVWVPEATPARDYGTGSTVAARPELFDGAPGAGGYVIPPRW